MDIRPVILVVIVAILVYFYLGSTVLLWCILAGLFIAFLCLIYVILRSEGRIKIIVRWFKKICKKYEKFEAKIFKWIDRI